MLLRICSKFPLFPPSVSFSPFSFFSVVSLSFESEVFCGYFCSLVLYRGPVVWGGPLPGTSRVMGSLKLLAGSPLTVSLHPFGILVRSLSPLTRIEPETSGVKAGVLTTYTKTANYIVYSPMICAFFMAGGNRVICLVSNRRPIGSDPNP